mgnify:CR=1 FL=1
MTTLLYRGHGYVQHKDQVEDKNCVELTYRRSHYSTCRDQAKEQLGSEYIYRGLSYVK